MTIVKSQQHEIILKLGLQSTETFSADRLLFFKLIVHNSVKIYLNLGSVIQIFLI